MELENQKTLANSKENKLQEENISSFIEINNPLNQFLYSKCKLIYFNIILY